jgi:hypothetical protein
MPVIIRKLSNEVGRACGAATRTASRLACGLWRCYSLRRNDHSSLLAPCISSRKAAAGPRRILEIDSISC